MTDNTQPEAGSTHIIRYALELGLLWVDGDGRDKVREALNALEEVEDLSSYGAQLLEENGRKVLSYWPYCNKCHKPFEFEKEEPFAHCGCPGSTEWGDPRPASWVQSPTLKALEELGAAPQQESQEPCGWAADQVRIEKTEKNGWCAYLDIENEDGNRIGTINLCRGINSENAARALAQNWVREFVPEPKQVAWEGGEEWEALAWHLCAEENGEDACGELLWEGGPIPEPWGDRWMKYESDAKRMIELVRKVVTVPPTAQAEGWRSMETAPRDGTEVLANTSELGSVVVYWDDGKSQWGTGFGYLDRDSPTHWMPLPPPPTSAEGVQHG